MCSTGEHINSVRYQVLTSVNMKEIAFWDIAPSILVEAELSEVPTASGAMSHKDVIFSFSFIFVTVLNYK